MILLFQEVVLVRGSGSSDEMTRASSSSVITFDCKSCHVHLFKGLTFFRKEVLGMMDVRMIRPVRSVRIERGIRPSDDVVLVTSEDKRSKEESRAQDEGANSQHDGAGAKWTGDCRSRCFIYSGQDGALVPAELLVQ